MLSMYFRFLSSFFFSTSLLYGQGSFPGASTAGMLGMADNGLHSKNMDALIYNPAGLSLLTDPTFSFNGINYWSIQKFNFWQVGIGIPLRAKDALGGQLLGFTPGNFSYLKAGLAYARQLSPAVFLGLQGYLHQLDPGNTGQLSHSVHGALGVQIQIAPTVKVAALLTTLFPFEGHDALPPYYPDTYKIGVSVNPIPSADMTLEVQHSLYRIPELSWGLAYRFGLEKYHWRMGINWSRKVYATGFGWKLLGLSMDISTLYQSQLGFTQAFGLTFTLNKKNGSSTD